MAYPLHGHAKVAKLNSKMVNMYDVMM